MVRTALAYVAALALALTSMAALGPLVYLNSWYWGAAGGAMAVGAAMAISSLVAPRVGPWVVGPVVALATASAMYAPMRAWGLIVPTPGSVTELAAHVRSGAHQAYLAVPPTGALGYVPTFLGCCAIITTLAIALVGVRLHQPLIAAAISLGWWVLPVGRGFQVSPAVCLAYAASIALLLAAVPARKAPSARPDRLGWAGVVAMAVVAGIVAVPLSGPLATLAGTARPGTPLGGVRVPQARIELSASADLLQDLTAPTATIVMERTGAGDGAPLRVHVAESFDGTRWDALGGAQDNLVLGADQLTGLAWAGGGPVGDQPRSPTDAPARQTRLALRALTGIDLPIVLSPRQISSDVQLVYSPSRDTVSIARPDEGVWLDLSYVQRDLSAATLDGLEPVAPDGRQDALLQVPPTAHAAEIAALAGEITAAASTTYRKLVALQSYLRSMTYSLEAPAPVTGDAVWDFLQAGQGYCVHFATAFVMMARDLGVPARLGIGYMPGSGTNADILSTDAHAWPEVYFDQVGWVSFEPTPASHTAAITAVPAVPAVDDVGPAQSAGPAEQLTPTPTPSAPVDSARRSAGEAIPGWVWGALGAAVVLAALAFVVVRRKRVARWHRALPAWRSVRKAAARRGITWPDSATVRGAQAILAPRLGPQGRDALEALARAVETDLYGAPRLSASASPARLRATIVRQLPRPTLARKRR